MPLFARILILGLLLIAACDTGVLSPTTPATRKIAVKDEPQQTPETSDSDESEDKSKALLQRALAAKELALEAVKLDGSAEAQEALKTPTPCNQPMSPVNAAIPEDIGLGAACVFELALKLGKAKNRRDILNSEPLIQRMEGYAEGAMQRARKRTGQNETGPKGDTEDSALNAAANRVAPECEKSLLICEKRCRAAKEESGPYCFVLATIKMTAVAQTHDPKDLQLAADALQIACNLKFGKSSCDDAARARVLVPKAVQAQEKAKDDAFNEAASIADDIAAKTFIANTAAKLGSRAARQVPRMRLVIQEQTKEQFCPAKKAAITVMGTTEFNKRAAAHCKDEPPTAGGLSGPVTLPNECRAVFASGCP